MKRKKCPKCGCMDLLSYNTFIITAQCKIWCGVPYIDESKLENVYTKCTMECPKCGHTWRTSAPLDLKARLTKVEENPREMK